jgi:hypothetical protein
MTYPYHGADGNLLYETIRYEPKDFRQRQPDGNGGWTWNLNGVERVLYRLPELLADQEPIIYIVEGERDADRLASLGLTATTSPGGAGKWKSQYSQSLRGHKVVILPDNDDAGRNHADQVAASLAGVAASVKIIHLPGLPEKQDVTDWLDAGHTVEELLSLVASPTEAPEDTPQPASEDGAGLLDEVSDFIRRYVVLSPDQVSATALWVIHTHAIDAADATPYLHVTSPEKRSGKTRLLEVLDLLAARPWFSGRITAAVLQRRLERDHPALLLDETDAVFKKESEYSEALRAILNAGHRRGCKAWLCSKKGGDIELVEFDVFGPKCLAGIGKLPETIADRAIRIVLRRRAPSEPVTRFRRREAEEQARSLRERAERWATANMETLKASRPHIPDFIDDRATDGWEPFFAIADAAGAGWPQRARMVALTLSDADVRDDESLGAHLLADLRAIFEERGVDRLPSIEICRALNGLEESPWGDLRGKPLDPRGLARRLRAFPVRPHDIRFGNDNLKGYDASDFADAWERYLPPMSVGAATRATSATRAAPESESGPPDVADVALVAANTEQGETPRQPKMEVEV